MNKQPLEQVLIPNAVKGDLDAFNQLVLLYQDIAYRYASALAGDPDEAEDVTQESFIKAFQNIASFHGGSFRAWLLRIITNTIYDHSRRRKKYPAIPLYPEDPDGEEFDSPQWLSDPAAFVEAAAQRNEEARYLYQMLEELPALYRSVITLVDVYELDYVETAELLHIPVGTVKSRLARARMQIRDRLLGTQFIPRPAAGCLQAAGL